MTTFRARDCRLAAQTVLKAAKQVINSSAVVVIRVSAFATSVVGTCKLSLSG